MNTVWAQYEIQTCSFIWNCFIHQLLDCNSREPVLVWLYLMLLRSLDLCPWCSHSLSSLFCAVLPLTKSLFSAFLIWLIPWIAMLNLFLNPWFIWNQTSFLFQRVIDRLNIRPVSLRVKSTIHSDLHSHLTLSTCTLSLPTSFRACIPSPSPPSDKLVYLVFIST